MRPARHPITALQQQHFLFRVDQRVRRHRAAKTAANNNCVVQSWKIYLCQIFVAIQLFYRPGAYF
ncbi:MAG: hypothetical protein ALAOOOJD_01259 [bacterium]|nr:hypothetical protein [bacterium]